MAQVTDEAVILTNRPFRESSLIVSALTRSWGRVSLLAKGARRLKGGSGASLEPFTHAEIVYYEKPGRTLQTLAASSIVEGFARLRSSLASVAVANLIAEVADRLVPEGQPHGEVFSALVGALRRLDGGEDPAAVAARFVLRAIGSLGYAPSLDECVVCGRRVPRGEAAFSPLRGGLLCGECECDAGGLLRLTGGSVGILRRLAAGWDTARLRISPEQRRELLAVAEAVAETQLDRPLRSADFARQVLFPGVRAGRAA